MVHAPRKSILLDPNLPSFLHACTITLLGSLVFFSDFYSTFWQIRPLSLHEMLSVLPSWMFQPPSTLSYIYSSLFKFSVAYFILDIFVMGISLNSRPIKCKRLKFVGFVLHHVICIYGLAASLWFEALKDARIIMLCFVLSELSNPIRGYAAIFMQDIQFNEQKKHDVVSSSKLESLKLAYLALFFTTRMICARLAFAYVFVDSSPALLSTQIASSFILLFSGISAIQIFRDPDIIF